MTNEEAVRILRRIQEPEAWEPQINGAAFEALDMAVEALSRQQAAGSKDLISRAEAIDAFNTNLNELVVGGEENAKTVENYLNRVIDKIKCLPSAHPKRGRWERGFDGNHAVCSNCQAWWIPFGEGYKTDYHFCPNCGAKMEDSEDEND